MALKTALAGLFLSSAAFTCAHAEISDNVVKVGVLNDISGVFQDTNGMGSVEAARMAADDFAGGGKNIKVEIVYADHQNKADVGSSIVRRWLDLDQVDAVVDVPAMMNRGGDSWYFLTVDYALGKGIEAEATDYIHSHGGKVLGSSKHPLGTADMSSLLLQAQSSKAKVIGLANAGADTINAVKQGAEFGIRGSGQSMVAFLVFLNDVHAMGLNNAQGLLLTEAFYWDLNDETRAWAKRFTERFNGKYPSANQAGVYAATLAYLKAVAATGSDDAKDVVPQMKKAAFHDALFGDMQIRPDGRGTHAIYLFEVKKPAESKYPYDYYKLLETVPADQAFRPIAQGNCPMLGSK
jgi:branched-chain amino acid transport system substrate-binding protein